MAHIEVNTRSYSGPMDLLLDLVQQSKVNIYEIEIAQITEAYLQALQEIKIEAEDLSDFIRMASLLVVMKVRTLKKDQLQEEEEGLTQEELIARLLRYRTYKEIAHFFADLAQQAKAYHYRVPADPASFRKDSEEVLPEDPLALYDALVRLRTKGAGSTEGAFFPEKIVSLEDYPVEVVAQKIREKLLSGQYFTFRDLIGDTSYSRAHTIAAFLSLLEMSRTNLVRLYQKSFYDELEVEVQNGEPLDTEKGGPDATGRI